MARKFEIPVFYQSPIISRVKKARHGLDRLKRDLSPSVLDFGPARFFLARHFGFCYGVENAIEIAYRTLEAHPDRANLKPPTIAPGITPATGLRVAAVSGRGDERAILGVGHLQAHDPERRDSDPSGGLVGIARHKFATGNHNYFRDCRVGQSQGHEKRQNCHRTTLGSMT